MNDPTTLDPPDMPDSVLWGALVADTKDPEIKSEAARRLKEYRERLDAITELNGNPVSTWIAKGKPEEEPDA